MIKVDLQRIQTICQEHPLDKGMLVSSYLELMSVVKDLTHVLCPTIAKKITMNDINRRLASMARCPEKTIHKCIEFYLEHDKQPLRDKGWIAGYVWSSRTILMYYIICKKMIDHPEKSAETCATEAYTLLLKPYHNVIIRNLSTAALNFTPKRENLNLDQEQLTNCIEHLKKWVQIIYKTHEKYKIQISY